MILSKKSGKNKLFLKRKTYLSIDIGNRNIKIVQGKYVDKKVEIMNYDIIDTPCHSVSDGKIIGVNAIVQSIRDSINKNKMWADELILLITGTGIITRDIQVPKSSDEEMAKIVEYQAQQYFPVDLNNYILDFKVLEEVQKDEGTFSRVLLVAVPYKQVEEYMKIPKMLKMEINSIDLHANCVAKFLFGENNLNINAEKDSSELPREFVVLDIGADTTEIYIFCNNSLKFNRILLTGGSDIDKKIAQVFQIDSKEAENNKIFKARVNDEAEKWEITEEVESISRCAKESITNFAEDLTRFLDFYNSRAEENCISKIYVCGGGSKLQGLSSFLGDSFDIPAGAVAPTPYVDIQYSGKKNSEELNRDFVFLINAIGGLIR